MAVTKTSIRSFIIKFVLGLAISTALVLLLFRYAGIDIKQLVKMFSSMSWSWCMAGFGIWFGVHVLRSARFVMISPRTPFLTMLCIAAVHNFFLRLLPMRTGELTYGFLVKRAGTGG